MNQSKKHGIIIGFFTEALLVALFLAGFEAYETPRKLNWDLDWSGAWVQPGEKLQSKHLALLLELSENSPTAKKIVDNAKKLFDINEPSEFLEYFVACDATDMEYGKSHIEANTEWLGKSILETHQFKHKTAKTKFIENLSDYYASGNNQLVQFSNFADYMEGKIVKRDPACLRMDQSLENAFNTFIHELTHITEFIPESNYESFLARNPDFKTFLQSALHQHGGEFDAHKNGYQALIEVRGFHGKLPNKIKTAFNPSGELLHKRELSHFILHHQGYLERFEQEYDEEITNGYSYFTSKISFFNQLQALKAAELEECEKVNLDCSEGLTRVQTHFLTSLNLRNEYARRLGIENLLFSAR